MAAGAEAVSGSRPLIGAAESASIMLIAFEKNIRNCVGEVKKAWKIAVA